VGSPLEDTVSTSHNLRKAVRDRMAETGESYTEALRAITAGRFETREIRDDATPPGPWKVHLHGEPSWRDPDPLPHWTGVIAVMRNRDGVGQVDQVVAFDRATGVRLGETTVPHVPTEELLRGYANHHTTKYPGSQSHQQLLEMVTRGRPDLMAHRLGFEIVGLCEWQEWSDGSQRIPAMPTAATHSATITTLARDEGGPGVRLVVLEHPETVVVDVVVPGTKLMHGEHRQEQMMRVLAEHGFVRKHAIWQELSAGVFYQIARPGFLAERAWFRRARVRFIRSGEAHSPEGPPMRFRIGEEQEMVQSGRAGQAVDYDTWWTSFDIDGAKIFGPDAVEVVDVIEERPPTWKAAALSAATITRLLEPFHAGAAQAAAAWVAAGLHVARDVNGLLIRTPAPERRAIGRVRSDYWDGGKHKHPYEVVVRDAELSYDQRVVQLEQLPLDPVAALADAERQQPAKS
jgi:hypothetical protein